MNRIQMKPDLTTQAEALIADCWSAAFECQGFEPGPALPGYVSKNCAHCGDMRWLHDTARIIRGLLTEQNASEWQPIETAPKDGTHVWLWNGYRRAIGWYKSYEDGSDGWHRQSIIGEGLGRRDIDPETHWMPLPDPPRDAGKKQAT
jgi:hypothetical protein